MTLDPARARFPECGECGNGVDENDPHSDYEIIDGIHYHSKCVTPVSLPTEAAKEKECQA